MADRVTQLEILADALTRIVDLADAAHDPSTPLRSADCIERAGNTAAEALAAAATFGDLPPPKRPADLAARAAAAFRRRAAERPKA